MYENTVIKENPPESRPVGDDEYKLFCNIERMFIDTLSENQFTISQARYLFNHILNQFEMYMPVTNHKKS